MMGSWRRGERCGRVGQGAKLRGSLTRIGAGFQLLYCRRGLKLGTKRDIYKFIVHSVCAGV